VTDAIAAERAALAALQAAKHERIDAMAAMVTNGERLEEARKLYRET
jgi:hypothetical protein